MKDLWVRWKKADKAYVTLTALAVFSPLIITYALILLAGNNPLKAIPYNGDERWWYTQIAGTIKYGSPLGYFGYNISHAKIGTFASWGPAPVIPYAIIGKLFGWSIYSMARVNIFFLCLANFLFILLTKPKKKQLPYIASANLLSFISIYYSTIAMAECSRYAMAIVLCACVYRCEFLVVSKSFRFIILPILLIYATFMYMILAVFIPVYLLIIFKKYNRFVKILVSFGITAITVILIRSINGVFCAPYLSAAIPPFSSFFTLSGIKALFERSVVNLHGISPASILKNIHATHGLFSWFSTFVWLLFGLCLYYSFKKEIDRKHRILFGFCAYLIFLFLAGHIIMYNTTTWTFMRGMNAAVCVVILLCASKKEMRRAFNIIIIFCILGSGSFLSEYTTYRAGDSQYYCYDADYRQIIQLRSELNDVMNIAPHKDPWQNTVACKSLSAYDYLALPIGVGIQSTADGKVNDMLKYVYWGDEDQSEETKLHYEEYLNSGFSVLWQDGTRTLLVNNKYRAEQ